MKVFSHNVRDMPHQRATKETLIHGPHGPQEHTVTCEKLGAQTTLGLPHLCDPQAF